MHIKLFVLHINTAALIFLIALTFSSCAYEGTEADKAAIEGVWASYYSPTFSQVEKNLLLSEDYKKDYQSQIQAAFNMSEARLKKMPFEKKLTILGRRYVIDSLKLKSQQLNTFEKAFNAIETPSSELISTDQGLKNILFINDKEAYGIFWVFMSEKSNQFVKEGLAWKINPQKEHKKYKGARYMLKQKYIKAYGNEHQAVSELVKLATGRAPIWQPLES